MLDFCIPSASVLRVAEMIASQISAVVGDSNDIFQLESGLFTAEIAEAAEKKSYLHAFRFFSPRSLRSLRLNQSFWNLE